jgi:homoserine kinase
MKLRVRVPATTANLGPGFDCLGLALDLWNIVQVEPIARGLQVTCRPEDPALPCDGRNLVIQSMRRVYRRAHKPFPPLRVRIDCHIPIGRGLGSSASAIVAGVLAANALLGERFSPDEILKMATEIEGHPDNIAPALYGGLVIAVREGGEVKTMRQPVPRDLRCILFIPSESLPTKTSRDILPRAVPHADAVYNIGRAALWIAALQARRWDWLDVATGDRLHQPYRAKLVRGMEVLFKAARRAGAHGVALSGAGPSVIAFSNGGVDQVARALDRAAARIHWAGQTCVVRVSARGAQVTRSR